MKKIFLAFFLLSSIVFAANTIELTGEYAKDLGNPFRVLLEKKDKNISIFSQNNDVVLKVESDLDKDSTFLNRLDHPSSYILKNETIENVVKQFYGEEYNVVLGNEQSGSIGDATKKLLTKFDLYEKAISNAVYLVPDSRNLINTIKNGEADLTLNWYATAFWDDNKEFVEALVLDEKYSEKSKLVFNLLSTSQNKELSKKFMDYASSIEGREIFKKYGFLDDEDMKNFDKVTF